MPSTNPKVLRLIYSEQLGPPVESLEEMQALITAANRFNLLTLRSCCEQQLCESIDDDQGMSLSPSLPLFALTTCSPCESVDDDQVLDVLILSCTLDCPGLKAVGLEHIRQAELHEPNAILGAPSWLRVQTEWPELAGEVMWSLQRL